MRIFLDTNIILDYIDSRGEFSDDAAEIFALAESDDVTLCASVLTFCNIAYILRKVAIDQIKQIFTNLNDVIEILPTNELTLEKAIQSDFLDFEDALQYYCAEEAMCDCIITRNTKDFTSNDVKIKVLTPRSFFEQG